MHSAPFETWDGAEAIFTFAHSPTAIAIFLVLTVAVIVGVIAQSARHENHSFKKAEDEN